MSTEKIIYNLYLGFLHREPELGAVELWQERIKSGWSIDSIIEYFLQSEEFKMVKINHKGYGCPSRQFDNPIMFGNIKDDDPLLDKELICPSDSFEYYKGEVYWNDFEVVRLHINRTISDNDNVDWCRHVIKRLGTFQRAFFINCGSGWVERDAFKLGLFNEVIGFDFSEKMIDEAIKESQKISMPATYLVADCNKFDATGISVDLVVNYAAMHHVAYINQMTRTLAEMIQPNGYYVAFDYVGAHRNQYSLDMWSEMVKFNETLPERYKAKLTYPHIKTMIHVDPTEAIHSELQIDVMKRYFDIEEYVELGGSIAYQILFENIQLFNERNSTQGSETIRRIIDADKKFLMENPGSNLFAFWIARPKVETFPDRSIIDEWQRYEDDRELSASKNQSRYYSKTALEIIYNAWDEELTSYVHRLADK
jgi:ubiquinone/menaquinone biosynthesis C-methylase UbiE